MNSPKFAVSRRQVRGLLLAGVILLLLAGVAYAAPAVIIDQGGPDDETGQKDLSQLSLDTAGLPGSVVAGWSWDDTAWSGNNTGDACSLWDTNGDKLADYSLCVTVEGLGQYQNTVLYTCGNAYSTKCNQSLAPVPTFQSTCSASVITNSDPFRANAAHTANKCSGTGCVTDDTVATCQVNMADFPNANLLNVCSYPSREPNSDPSDCVLDQPLAVRVASFDATAGSAGLPIVAVLLGVAIVGTSQVRRLRTRSANR